MPSATSAGDIAVELTAVVIAVTGGEPCVLVLEPGPEGTREWLPSGPLRPDHRTLQSGLRRWVETQTGQRLGYVEQLYTFGDRPEAAPRTLSIAYLALVADARPPAAEGARWRAWYDLFPWEDHRDGAPPVHATIAGDLRGWAESPGLAAAHERAERARLAFGLGGARWDEERALERYELLYEADLVAEAAADRGETPDVESALRAGRPMSTDHRRIVATAISRLRGKIKYRPVLFELLPPTFTLLRLQRTAEALSGVRLHKQNFRRLVAQQGLVEETGAYETATGGRPAKLMRFRQEVLMERPAPGVRLTATRRAAYP